jgi:hypothetical protein
MLAPAIVPRMPDLPRLGVISTGHLPCTPDDAAREFFYICRMTVVNLLAETASS